MGLNLPKRKSIFRGNTESSEIRAEFGDQKLIRSNYLKTEIADAFLGSSLDSGYWDSLTNGTASIAVGSDEVNLSTGATSASTARISKDLSEGDVSVVEFEARVKFDAGDPAGATNNNFGILNTAGDGAGGIFFAAKDDNTVRIVADDEAESGAFDIDIAVDTTSYQNYKIILEEKIAYFFINNNLVGEIKKGEASFPPFKTFRVQISITNSGATDRDMDVNWVRVRTQ